MMEETAGRGEAGGGMGMIGDLCSQGDLALDPCSATPSYTEVIGDQQNK